jgi:hypothetical protein
LQVLDHALNYGLGHKRGACIIEVDSICCAGCIASQTLDINVSEVLEVRIAR